MKLIHFVHACKFIYFALVKNMNIMKNKAFDESSANEAFKKSKKSKKPVFVDFWSTGCKGCEKMESTTYHDENVMTSLNDFVFLKYNTKNVQKNFRELFPTIGLGWTPSFYIYSPDGKIMRNMLGYLPPEQIIMELKLGLGQSYMRSSQYGEAIKIFKDTFSSTKETNYIQEGLYYAGVAAYYQFNGSLDELSVYWNELLDKYPNSLWAQRADVL